MPYWFSLKSIYDVPIPYKTNCHNINHKLDLINAAPAIGKLSSDARCRLIGDVKENNAFMRFNNCFPSQLLAEANKHNAKGVIMELKEQSLQSIVCKLSLFYVQSYYFNQLLKHLEITHPVQLNFEEKVGQLNIPEMIHVDANSAQDFSLTALSYPNVSATSARLFTTIPVREGFYELADELSLAAAYAAGTAALFVHDDDRKRVMISLLKVRFSNTALPVIDKNVIMNSF
ncbi:hypothetical protein BDF19DRAFT_473289 [Syncephalis fuscata]|nr:hypothetical protein BDF19DRAFT_473289 [Syncephalis fuscata]